MGRPSRRKQRRPPSLRAAALAFFGAIAVGVGTFAPAVRIDFAGRMTIWELMEPLPAGMVLAATGLTLLALWHRRHGYLVLTTQLLWGALAYPWWEAHVMPGQRGLLARIGRAFEDAFIDVVLELRMVHILWGTPLFFGGCLMLSAAAWIALFPGRPVESRGKRKKQR